ncbi:MAG: hypothetical protein EHM24_15020 [Acidobacteria bacterium]|nr:MAG: hypothetical protein EHM24_15020 [Acidobacteriota bacterium]
MQARIVDPMGFAVNPAIANRPIALEVDKARLGQMRRLLLAFLVLVAAACFDGWQRSQTVDHARDVGSLQRQRAGEEVRSRHLRVEWESLREPERIAQQATKHLGLVEPKLSDVVVLERVVPADQPPSSVVASR